MRHRFRYFGGRAGTVPGGRCYRMPENIVLSEPALFEKFYNAFGNNSRSEHDDRSRSMLKSSEASRPHLHSRYCPLGALPRHPLPSDVDPAIAPQGGPKLMHLVTACRAYMAR